MKILFIAITLLLLGGCASPKSFLDPSIQKISYGDIQRRSEPLKLKLLVEFQVNGEHEPVVDSTLKDNAERVLRSTGVIVPIDDQSDGEIKVIVNNFVDKAKAFAKGAGSGATFGIVGTTVLDAYEMTVSITTNGKTVTQTEIKHGIYSIIGSGTPPDGIASIPPNVAFARVVEQMLLNALQEMQSAGELTQIQRHDTELLG